MVSHGSFQNLPDDTTYLDYFSNRITSGAGGTNSDTSTCADDAGTSEQTATIRITATGATGSPMTVGMKHALFRFFPLCSDAVHSFAFQGRAETEIVGVAFRPATIAGLPSGDEMRLPDERTA